VARVTVRGFTVVRDALGADVVEVDVPPPETVQALLDALLRQHDGALREVLCEPASGQMAPFLMVLNEEIISSTLDLDRAVKSGDAVSIIFPIGGG